MPKEVEISKAERESLAHRISQLQPHADRLNSQSKNGAVYRVIPTWKGVGMEVRLTSKLERP